jgi:hypothetical protein
MQDEPTSIDGAATARVSGLGLCDALRVELDPTQVSWLLDELEDRRGPLEDELARLRGRQAAAGELADREYELRLLRLMRASLVGAAADQPAVWIGPAGLVLDVARATMSHVAAMLAEEASDRGARGRHGTESLSVTATAAHAWALTVRACELVSAFTFDGDADPARRW